MLRLGQGSLVAVCHREVATDEVREVSQSHASDSPVPGEDLDVRTARPDEGYRMAEDGVIPERYPLVALPKGGYRQRTRQNVIDSDGTAIIYDETLKGGTRLTRNFVCAAQEALHSHRCAASVGSRGG
jgi:Circularly permutated YpsA SLOG family